MSIEDELRDSLHRRAASVDAQPDLDDVVERTAHRDRRTRRLLTAGLVVALIAGPLAGFAIGRAGDDSGSDVATGGGREFAATAGDAAQSSLAIGVGGPLEKLFFRTSADGVQIRGYRSAGAALTTPAAPPCPTGPADECLVISDCGPVVPESVPTSTVTGELSTDAAVTVAGGSIGGTSGDDPDVAVSAASWGTFGVEESAPARWVIASVNTSVTRVRATFPGGTTDEMEPVDGVVILASRVDDPNLGGGALEALAADGSVVQSIDLTAGYGGMASAASSSGPVTDLPGSFQGSAESSAILRQESTSSGTGSSSNASSSVSSSVSGSSGVARACPPVPTPAPAPPATLPAPGEQPADPAAARAEIATAFAKSFDGNVSPEESKLYEEGPGVSAEEVARSGYAAQATHTKATVTDVVFTSPTEAAVRYDISVDNWPNQFPGQSGTALLIDGRWKVSQATVCAAAAIGGLACG